MATWDDAIERQKYNIKKKGNEKTWVKKDKLTRPDDSKFFENDPVTIVKKVGKDNGAPWGKKMNWTAQRAKNCQMTEKTKILSFFVK